METVNLNIPKWNVQEELGYTPITTFWEDFSMAESFGATAIRDTFNRAFKEWRTNYKYLTEFVMVLNHKIWQHYKPNSDSPLAALYNDLYLTADTWAMDNLKDEELDYYIRTLD